MTNWSRRQVLAVSAILPITLSGCLGDDAADDTADDVPPDDIPARIHTFLRHARLYDETITDARGEDEVEVIVGAGQQGFAYDPVALRVDVGTTVEWVWSGTGGGHDVVSTGGSDFSFESERTREAGTTFSYTFDDGGVALYECRPHRTQGMLGAVDVMFPDDTVSDDH